MGERLTPAARGRVSACAGQVTATLRRAWDLNRILSDKPEKSRDDHRHHAVDALTVALSSARTVQDLARAAEEAERTRRRRVALPVPWVGFAEATRSAVEGIKVSHRPVRKLSGPLHDETFYSPPRRWVEGGGKGRPKEKEGVHYRVPLTKLESPKDFASIVDSQVRAAVEEKAAELGGGGNRFQNNWPHLKTRKGGSVPIRRVRIRKVERVKQIGDGSRKRFVIPGSNHHMEVLAQIDAKGKIRGYDFHTVSMLEAYERNRQKTAVVRRDHGPEYEFRCTLSEGDMVDAKRPGDPEPRIWKVRSVRESGQLDLTLAEDARKKADTEKAGLLWKPAVQPLFRDYAARKVLVTHLGEILPAND
jgi:CRISPR-associated endonuclease Csn1